MMGPAELVAYIEALRGAGVRGRAQIGPFNVDVTPPPTVSNAGPARARSAADDYERMLYACTEGIPEDDDPVHEARHE